MNVYRLAYWKNSVFYSQADLVLTTMKNTKSIRREELYKILSSSDYSAEFYETLSYLVDEGFVEVNEWGYRVTTKGSLFLGRGGYKGEARRKVFWAVGGIVTTIGAIFTIVAVIAQ